jgi:two-component sensor histidine kinase
VLSAKSDEELKIELLKKGVQDYLNKPFTIEELKARVNNIIKMKIIKDRLQNDLKSHSEDITTLVEELTERKNLIELSLQEKEVLLKEIHHRVKNNLQVISSLLNLQSHAVKDPESFEIFRESQNRVRSMALIHEKLYQSKNLMQVNLEEYVNDLTANLYNSYNLGSDYLSMKVEINKIFLNIDTAINLGLILNELISNSLKHAFNGKPKNNREILF